MLIVDRINRAVLKLIRRRAGTPELGSIRFDDVAVQLHQPDHLEWSIAWSDVERVTAFSSAGFIGDTIMLAIEAASARKLLTEDHPCWRELVEALPEHLRGAEPFASWAVRLIANAQPVVVFERG